MAKRTATTELTDRNWDQEDEQEDPGEFKKANQDTMKQRPVIKAKRRGLNTEGGSSSFSGFSGFSFKPTTTSTPFNFNVKSVSNGQSQNGSNGDNKGTQLSTEKSDKEKSPYLQNLKNLNESVLQWIKSHVEKNPYCILTPIFKDYKKHLTELDKEKESSTSSSQSTVVFSGASENKVAASDSAVKSEVGTSSTTTASVAMPTMTTAASAPVFSGFNFKPSTAMTPAFSFAVSKPGGSTDTAQTEDGGDDEYVPPKPEIKEVVEEGSIHTIKCKLFYQKDGNWTDRGVGNLHLKEIDKEAQLLVRADTNLGNILLNIMLTPSVPLKRQGKNNVSLICIPNPPINPKDDKGTPVPMLIRVKTGEDADQLLDKMNELRNKS